MDYENQNLYEAMMDNMRRDFNETVTKLSVISYIASSFCPDLQAGVELCILLLERALGFVQIVNISPLNIRSRGFTRLGHCLRSRPNY